MCWLRVIGCNAITGWLTAVSAFFSPTLAKLFWCALIAPQRRRVAPRLQPRRFKKDLYENPWPLCFFLSLAGFGLHNLCANPGKCIETHRGDVNVRIAPIPLRKRRNTCRTLPQHRFSHCAVQGPSIQHDHQRVRQRRTLCGWRFGMVDQGHWPRIARHAFAPRGRWQVGSCPGKLQRLVAQCKGCSLGLTNPTGAQPNLS